MRRSRVVLSALVAVAAVVVATGAASGAAAPGSSRVATAGEQLYYGSTSKSGDVMLAVRGNQIVSEPGRSHLSYQSPAGLLTFQVPGGSGFAFGNGRLTWHRFAQLPGGTVEQWFTAALAGGGSRASGTFREVSNNNGRYDTGTIRWNASRLAAENGAEWSATPASGSPVAVRLGYTLVPSHIVTTTGKRWREPAFTFSAAALQAKLACRDGAGAATAVPVTLPPLKGTLVGSIKYGLTGVAQAAATTREGVPVQAQLVVRGLGWHNGQLSATGALRIAATPSTGTCDVQSDSFTLRPH